jgi:hypothetical protein
VREGVDVSELKVVGKQERQFVRHPKKFCSSVMIYLHAGEQLTCGIGLKKTYLREYHLSVLQNTLR